MLIFFVCAIMFSALLLSLHFYMQLVGSSKALNIIEKQVAADMQMRAHQLCLLAYEAQRFGNSREKAALDDEFQDFLHLYIEDYQAEVAKKIKEHNINEISAYGFINLSK